MEQIGFLMKLKPGNEAEYRKRHDEIWPELSAALAVHGARDYSIFLNPETLDLFAVMRLVPGHTLDDLPAQPIMRKWWDYMADLMLVDETNKPLQWPLERVFHAD